MIKNIFIAKLCFLTFFSCNFQTKELDHPVFMYKVFFAEGFDFDEIVFTINDKQIFNSRLKSSEVDGLTSKIYEINRKGDNILIVGASGEVIINNSKKLVLTVLSETRVYEYSPDKKLGSYILIELVNDTLIIDQQLEKPFFD